MDSFFYYADYYALAAKLAIFIFFVARAWREGVRGALLLAGSWAFLVGTFVTVMLSFHNAEIVYRALTNQGSYHHPGAGFTYDFRFYSLVLFGCVMISQGVPMMRAARGLSRGSGEAAGRLLRPTLVVLALSAPLIPIQFFGSVLTVCAALNLPALLLARRALRKASRLNEGAAPAVALAAAN